MKDGALGIEGVGAGCAGAEGGGGGAAGAGVAAGRGAGGATGWPTLACTPGLATGAAAGAAAGAADKSPFPKEDRNAFFNCVPANVHSVQSKKPAVGSEAHVRTDS